METISTIPGKLLYFTHQLLSNKKITGKEVAILKGNFRTIQI